jgi:inosine-uridine nucleoside N-ribohydrolase
LDINPSSQQDVQNQKAVDFIIRSCKLHKSDLGIVSFGPLTNLALAHRLEQCLGEVAVLSLTGGQHMGIGTTVRGCIEPNFAHDPLAAHILFEQNPQSTRLINKIYLNVIEKGLEMDFIEAITKCLSSTHLTKPFH